jgi:hypothetical protein
MIKTLSRQEVVYSFRSAEAREIYTGKFPHERQGVRIIIGIKESLTYDEGTEG